MSRMLDGGFGFTRGRTPVMGWTEASLKVRRRSRGDERVRPRSQSRCVDHPRPESLPDVSSAQAPDTGSSDACTKGAHLSNDDNRVTHKYLPIRFHQRIGTFLAP